MTKKNKARRKKPTKADFEKCLNDPRLASVSGELLADEFVQDHKALEQIRAVLRGEVYQAGGESPPEEEGEVEQPPDTLDYMHEARKEFIAKVQDELSRGRSSLLDPFYTFSTAFCEGWEQGWTKGHDAGWKAVQDTIKPLDIPPRRKHQ